MFASWRYIKARARSICQSVNNNLHSLLRISIAEYLRDCLPNANMSLALFPYFTRNDFWDVDDVSSMSSLFPWVAHDIGLAAPRTWSAVVDVRGFRQSEVTVSVDPAAATDPTAARRLVVSARQESPEGDFQELRRTVIVPDDVEIDKVTSHFERGQLHLHGTRQRKAQRQQLTAPTWKMSDNGQHMSSTMSIEGFKPEEIHLQQHGRWLTIEATHETANKDDTGSSSSSRRVIMRNMLPEGVKAATLRAQFNNAGQLMLTAETDADKAIAPRVVPVQPAMAVDQ